MLSRFQITAARGLLEWTQDDLAGHTSVTKDMISKIESGKSSGSLKTIQAIQEAMERAGLEFLENDGVRRRSEDVKVFKGKRGFIDFIWDVYEKVRQGGEIFVTNVDERDFLKWEGDEADAHMARMASISNLRMRILIEDGDQNIAASAYAKYKWLPKEKFSDLSLYIYGENTGLILFEEDNVQVFVIRHPDITRYFKMRFLEAWKAAKDIPND